MVRKCLRFKSKVHHLWNKPILLYLSYPIKTSTGSKGNLFSIKGQTNKTQPSYSTESQAISHSLGDRYKVLASTLKIKKITTIDKNQWILFTLGKPYQYEGLAYLYYSKGGWMVQDKSILNRTINKDKPFENFEMGGGLAGRVPQDYFVLGGHINNPHIASIMVEFNNSTEVSKVNPESPFYLFVKISPDGSGGIKSVIGLDKSNHIYKY